MKGVSDFVNSWRRSASVKSVLVQLAARAAMASAGGGSSSESEMEELYRKLTNEGDIWGYEDNDDNGGRGHVV